MSCLIFFLEQGLPGGGCAKVLGNTPYFPDLQGHWAEEEVLTLASSGIISGYPEGLFYPDREINMGEACKIVALAKGIKVEPSLGNSWAFPFYSALSKEGLLPWDYFEPDKKPSRGEVAELLRRAFYPKMEIFSDPSFPDVPQDHPFFLSVEVLHQSGIILGKEDGYFHPEEPMTRAELAVLLCRILQLEKVSVSQQTSYGQVNLACQPYRIPRGGFLKVSFSYPQGISFKLFFENQEVKMGEKGLTFIPIPIDEETGLKEVSLVALSQPSLSLRLKVLVTSYAVPRETIVLSQESLELLSPELLEEEREELYAALSASSEQTPDLPFELPLEAPILSAFASERVYPGWGTDYHWGVDLQGKEGTEVRAAGSGKVVLTKKLYSRGNTVIIDHGSGLFTLYYHLSAFQVQAGENVEKGQLIGLVGATGAVTGPHLHWEARIGKIPVNPILLLNIGGLP